MRTLRSEAAPAAPAPATEPERFLAGFFSASTDERRAAWENLSEQDQAKAAKNLLVKHWVSHILPAVQKYVRCASSANQPFDWIEAFTWQTGLSEEDDAEAEASEAYRTARDACFQFVNTAGPAAKLALWKQFGERPELLRVLARSGDGPVEWKAAPPGAPGDPLAKWVAEYRAAQTARTHPTQAIAEQQPEAQPKPDSDSESSEEDDPDYWDDLDTANFLVARRWTEGDIVHVAHQGQQFKFADKAKPAPRSASWSEFKVVKVTLSGMAFSGAMLKYVSGPVDQASFAEYLPRLAERALITLSQ